MIIEGNNTFMTWLGQSDSRNSDRELNPYLDSLIEELKAAELTIKFSDMKYMNSSTVPPIIRFLKKLDTKGIKTLIIYNAESKWQATSFKALENFSEVLSCITVKKRD